MVQYDNVAVQLLNQFDLPAAHVANDQTIAVLLLQLLEELLVEASGQGGVEVLVLPRKRIADNPGRRDAVRVIVGDDSYPGMLLNNIDSFLKPLEKVVRNQFRKTRWQATTYLISSSAVAGL
jgi:hypothetical protein